MWQRFTNSIESDFHVDALSAFFTGIFTDEQAAKTFI